MSTIRVGAVEYLNARPLVHGLDTRTDLFKLRFEVPSKCASLLYDKSVDVGLIPSIEYLCDSDYRIVPDIAVVSEGPVASVALFTERPIMSIRSIAVDSSSRTAVALLRILCAQLFDLEAKFVTMHPDLPAMLKRCDAALLIGDTALYTEHETRSLEKIDLGDEWEAMTGLPFVWSFWVGRSDSVQAEHIKAFGAARDSGLQALDAIAEQYALEGDDDKQVGIARAYLRDNVQYVLDARGRIGLKKFFDAAADLGIVPSSGKLHFYRVNETESA